MSDSHLTRPLCDLAEESAGLISQLCELMIREWTRSEWEQGKPLATFCHLASPGSSSLLEKTGLRVAAWAEQHKPAKERGVFVKRYTSLLELIGHFGALVQPAAHPLSGPYFSPMRTSIAVLDDNQLRIATLAGAHLPETLRAWASEMRPHAAESPTPDVEPRTGGGGDDEQDASHSDDFRCVRWFGQVYEFTPMQAACVKVLWEHWERGTPTVGQEYVLEAADASSGRLRDVFGKGKHPAWKTMITEAGKGAFRLQPVAMADGAA